MANREQIELWGKELTTAEDEGAQPYFLRLPKESGPGIKAGYGIPVQLQLLPEWNFFGRKLGWSTGSYWCISEVRSGGCFPTRGETLQEAVDKANEFCAQQGKEKCEAVFNHVIKQYGDLGRAA